MRMRRYAVRLYGGPNPDDFAFTVVDIESGAGEPVIICDSRRLAQDIANELNEMFPEALTDTAADPGERACSERVPVSVLKPSLTT